MRYSILRQLAAWLIHIFTASGAVAGVFSAFAVVKADYKLAFLLMTIAIIIDAVDGFLARSVDVKAVLPKIDGALLDNIVDFFNYTLWPAFFVLVAPLRMFPHGWAYVCVVLIIMSSAYQFTQADAKTEDHFFKGFPSYWNITVFYLFFWKMDPWVNFAVIVIFAVSSFLPIKFIYPSRVDYLTKSYILRALMVLATMVWGLATIGLLVVYPETSHTLVTISIAYMVLYLVLSLYRTFVPLKK